MALTMYRRVRTRRHERHALKELFPGQLRKARSIADDAGPDVERPRIPMKRLLLEQSRCALTTKKVGINDNLVLSTGLAVFFDHSQYRLGWHRYREDPGRGPGQP